MDALALARLLRQVPEGSNENPDYDFSGYYQKYGTPYKSEQDMKMSNMVTGQHGTDEFKLPEHMTFSRDSSYSQPDMQGGSWQQGGTDRWMFTPSQFNNQMVSPQQYSDYFRQAERKGTFVKLPDGSYVEGTK